MFYLSFLVTLLRINVDDFIKSYNISKLFLHGYKCNFFDEKISLESFKHKPFIFKTSSLRNISILNIEINHLKLKIYLVKI